MRKAGLFFGSVALIFFFVSATFAQDLPTVPGRIAYVSTDYNIYTVAPQIPDDTALTTDAGLEDNSARFYQMPTWSTDGRLAYFASLLDHSGSFSTEVFISPDGIAPGVSSFVADNQDITYANWSPQNCGTETDCRDLALLLSQQSGFVVELVRTENGAATGSVTGTGAPFYFSWSPDGTQMLWQRGNNHFEIYDTTESRVVDTLTQTPGAMFAPAWSPVDDRLLFAYSMDRLLIWWSHRMIA